MKMKTIEIGNIFTYYSEKDKIRILENILKTNNVKKSPDKNEDIFIVDREFVEFKLVDPSTFDCIF